MATGIPHFFEESRFMSGVGGITSGSVTFYYTATSTLAPIYSDADLTIPLANPVTVATGAVLPPIYLDPTIIYRRRCVFGDASVFDVDPVPSSYYISKTDLASASRGSSLVGFSPNGVGGVAETVETALRRIIHQGQYSSYANAKAAAGNTLPLFALPQTNTSLAGAKTRPGLVTGHMVIGDTNAVNIEPDAFVGLFADERYAGDVQQEMRGVSYTLRYSRSTVDEPVLGWDTIPVLGATVVEASNTNDILGNMKGTVGEVIFLKPTTGSRIIRNAYPLQATTFVDENITVTNWYGCVVGVPGHNSPLGGTITNGYGLFIDNLLGGGVAITNPAAIRIAGTGNSGRVWWGNSTWLTQDPSGKLEISLNSAALSLVNPKTSASATAGGGAALPATVGGYFSVIIGGVERKIPYYSA